MDKNDELERELAATQAKLATVTLQLASLILKIDTLYDTIAHDDDKHREWLKAAIKQHFLQS